MSVTSAAAKSSSVKICGLNGFIPHFLKPLIALLTLAAFMNADPKRVEI